MKSRAWIAILVSSVMIIGAGKDMAAQSRATGLSFAYNEFSAEYRMPLKGKEMLRLSASLDMAGVISGRNLYPGISADVLYLYEFARASFQSGESMSFMAGPGASAGYVRNHEDMYGAMLSLAGCIGFEYIFTVPVSISLTFEPVLGLHVSRDSFGYVSMSFYEAGLKSSLWPHLGLKYRF